MSDGNNPPSNVGTYLARRLINIGIREFYAVPGKSVWRWSES
jgi:TPP-dependent 2-oxoacid decarboxylase